MGIFALLALAGTAAAVECASDTSKIGNSTVSYGGNSFTIWQGYFTVTVTDGGAAQANRDLRMTALGSQVTSVETTNASGQAVLPVLTDTNPVLLRTQVRSGGSAPWEECGLPVPEPGPASPPAGPGGGGPGPGGAVPAAAPEAMAVLRPPPLQGATASGPGLSPLYNLLPGGGDWSLPAAAAPAAPAAAPASIGLAEALLLDTLMVGGAAGVAVWRGRKT